MYYKFIILIKIYYLKTQYKQDGVLGDLVFLCLFKVVNDYWLTNPDHIKRNILCNST